jgi:hypothetical protein
VQRRAGRHSNLLDDGRGVGGPPQRFGAEERDLGNSEATCRLHVPDKRGDKLAAAGCAEWLPVVDGVTEAEEYRLVDERFQPVAGNGGDEQMNRVRAEIDGRPEGCPPTGANGGAGGVRTGQCRRPIRRLELSSCGQFAWRARTRSSAASTSMPSTSERATSSAPSSARGTRHGRRASSPAVRWVQV